MRKALYGLMTLLSLAWVFIFRPVFLGGPASYIIVSGVSMQPTLYTGDLAVMQRRASYSVGDIVAFRVTGGHVIHRIVGGSAADGFILQGDNKPAVDPWRPKPEHVVGRMWFSVPGAGKLLNNLRQPVSIAALSGLAVTLFLGDAGKQRSKKRGKRMKAGSQSSRTTYTLPSWTLSALGGVGVLALVFAVAAVYGFLQPAQRAETVERLRFEHTAAFQYTVHTQPSLLYPQEIIGPIGPASPQAGGAAGFQKIDDQASSVAVPTDEAIPFSGPPVFTRLARSLDLNFTYQLLSELPAEVRGQVGIELQIKAGEGWVSTRTLVTPVPFNGPTAAVQASLDFPQILEFLQAVEEQTGFDPGTYEIALIPTVQLIGLVDSQPVEENYAPAFTLSLNDTQIHLDSELARSDVRRLEEPVMRPNQISLSVFALPVRTLRLVGLLGVFLSLLAGGVLTLIYLGANRGEVNRIRARYGSLIVPVAEADLDAGRQVQVAAMSDLARLAQREGSLIFHRTLPDREAYFVPAGQVVYIYQIVRPASSS